MHKQDVRAAAMAQVKAMAVIFKGEAETLMHRTGTSLLYGAFSSFTK